jgi:hypothetical protein
MTTRKKTAKASLRGRTNKAGQPSQPARPRLYTLEVFLLSGPITGKFAKKTPVVSRTIQIRGDQTLENLHEAIFDAYGPIAFQEERDEDRPPAGQVDRTTIDSLGLKVGDRFGYWFDFGDDWWHQINVEAIDEEVPQGKYPKVIKKVGANPPQYPPGDEE